MDDKTACQTPSREISARMKRLRLHATEFKQKVDRDFAPIDRDDSLNSTFDSEVGSPMRLITRASLCHDERLGLKFEHGYPAIRDRRSRETIRETRDRDKKTKNSRDVPAHLMPIFVLI